MIIVLYKYNILFWYSFESIYARFLLIIPHDLIVAGLVAL